MKKMRSLLNCSITDDRAFVKLLITAFEIPERESLVFYKDEKGSVDSLEAERIVFYFEFHR